MGRIDRINRESDLQDYGRLVEVDRIMDHEALLAPSL
jgi:hypothetical protein